MLKQIDTIISNAAEICWISKINVGFCPTETDWTIKLQTGFCLRIPYGILNFHAGFRLLLPLKFQAGFHLRIPRGILKFQTGFCQKNLWNLAVSVLLKQTESSESSETIWNLARFMSSAARKLFTPQRKPHWNHVETDFFLQGFRQYSNHWKQLILWTGSFWK